jgi:hypothetical protein
MEVSKMELNLKGKHIFSLIKLINKMNIKKEIKEFFKRATKNDRRKNNLTIKLKLALGDMENTPVNVNKVFRENEDLAQCFEEVQEEKKDLMLDIAFFIMEKAGQGEQEIFKLLADMYSMPVQEIEELGFNEMLEAVMKVIKNEEMQQGFLSIFK